MTDALSFDVDGEDAVVLVTPGRTLLEVLRDDLGRTAAKEGCDDGECGACTVLLDDRPVTSCLVLAHRAAGARIRTAEGVRGEDGGLHALQRELLARGAVQCGFCTPGILMAVLGAAAAGEPLTDTGARRALAGNLCRCTGYQKIVDAVVAWAATAPEVAAAHPERSLHGPTA